VSSEAGYRHLRQWVRTGSLNASLGEPEGTLHHLQDTLTFINPEYAYATIDVTAIRLRARNIVGTVMPATGVGPVIQAYAHDGAALPE